MSMKLFDQIDHTFDCVCVYFFVIFFNFYSYNNAAIISGI